MGRIQYFYCGDTVFLFRRKQGTWKRTAIYIILTEMEKVRLGRTNLNVTKLGWGGIPIQRVGEREAISVIQAVIEMGVDLLDTARAYTNSEHRIGLALQRTERPVILSSKSTVRTSKIYNEVHESLKQMRVRKIDIYHLHAVSDFEDYEKVMAPGGAYEGLKRACDERLSCSRVSVTLLSAANTIPSGPLKAIPNDLFFPFSRF